MLWQCSKPDPVKNFFPLPNEIFSLGLSSGELAVYSYLLYCEDRNIYRCWPSYRTIGKAVDMSVNTVRKYVEMLEERGLIVTEPTAITTKGGQKRNGSLLYTIRPIQEAVDLHNQRQLQQLEKTTDWRKLQSGCAQLKSWRQTEDTCVSGSESLCALASAEATATPSLSSAPL